MNITRRDAIRSITFGTLAVAAAPRIHAADAPAAATPPAAEGPFTLPPLPYAYDALEPFIDTQTMQIHHDKHHAAYVKNLNAAVADQSELAKKSAEDLLRDLASLPKDLRTKIANHGGGHVNHTFFWESLKKGVPFPKSDSLFSRAVNNAFGSYAGLTDALTKAAMELFGSGWAWLSVGEGHKFVVGATANQTSPLSQGDIPLLGIDVWEHAYYLKYQNRRADYVKAFFNVIDWNVVAARYDKTFST